MRVQKLSTVLVALAVVGAVGVIHTAALAANGDPVQWSGADGGNGHWYRLSPRPVDGLDDAIQLAAETSWLGQPGYVVSILGEGEKNFLVSTFGDADLYLIGYTDRAEEGVWGWVSGEPSDFTFWASGEPNDFNDEDYAVMNWQHEVQPEPQPPGAWNDVGGGGVQAIFEYDGVLGVSVDIKPGSATNPVNLKSKGIIPVAILTTDDFDATRVDPISAAFGPAGASEAHRRGHFSDVDGDGDIDLMLHFRTQETGIQPGHTEACLTAQTFDGQTIVGCDLITTRRSTNKVAKVTGTYEYITITGSWRAASISAHATDPVKGTWTWTAEGTTYRGPITCLRVSGDEAWLAGPDWEGPGGVFMYVQDGGTPGRNGDTAFTWHTDLGEPFEEVEELCEDTVKPPWFGHYPWPVVSGNLNVWDVP